jgi:DNA-binding NarL/FixJ family response regulator
MRRARLLLADDHGIVVEALRYMLERTYDIVGTARSGFELVDEVRRLLPDVTVADIDMPGLTGLAALRRLKEDAKIEAKVIFLTMHGDSKLATEAFRAGSAGYVLKDSAAAELHMAIEEVLQGRTYVTSRVAKGVLSSLITHSDDEVAQLTTRQQEVLRLVAEGHRMKEIAAALDLSTRTVESYKYEMMQSLGLGSTAELVRFAIRHGLVTQ